MTNENKLSLVCGSSSPNHDHMQRECAWEKEKEKRRMGASETGGWGTENDKLESGRETMGDFRWKSRGFSGGSEKGPPLLKLIRQIQREKMDLRIELGLVDGGWSSTERENAGEFHRTRKHETQPSPSLAWSHSLGLCRRRKEAVPENAIAR